MYRILVAILIVANIPALAAQRDYVGTWCQVFDDFTRVITIDESDDLKGFSIGNGAGEIGYHQSGHVSLGASRFQVVLDGQDQGVIDYKVRTGLSGRTLVFKYEDGQQEKFSACILKQK